MMKKICDFIFKYYIKKLHTNICFFYNLSINLFNINKYLLNFLN